jgi:uncharacterized glyoxalase superfamily protein PhnB
MGIETRTLYTSSSGDRWHLARDTETGRVFIRHEANPPSGGRVSEIAVETFLGTGASGPEHQELLRLIGTLVEEPSHAQPIDKASRQSGGDGATLTTPPALKLGWTILHVADVAGTVAFYERAFGLERRFVDPAGEYAEMATGATTLAFAAHALVDRLGAHPHSAASAPPHGTEIALVAEADAVHAAWERAVTAGAVVVKPLATMPWGQTVGFVRDPNGFLVEICTPTAS